MGEHSEDSKHGSDEAEDSSDKMDPERKGGQVPDVGGRTGNAWSKQGDERQGEKDTTGKSGNREKNPRREEDETR